jgi:hypothetical protein
LSPKIRRRIRYRNSETGLSFQFKFGSGDSDDQSSEYSSDFASDSNSSNESIDLPSAAESWSEGSSSVDDPASEGIDDQDSEESNDDDIGDVNSEIKSQSSEDDNESDIKSTLSIQSGHSQESNTFGSADSIISQILGDSPSSSEEGDIESDISEDEILRAEPAAANPEPEGPVVIGKPNSRVSCDFCNRNRFRTWYHCIICNDNNFDLCDHCERKGVWCLDLRHQLYKIVNRKPSGVVFRRNFNVRQELTVYRTDVPDEKRALFHYRKKYPTMLYESPPVIHQIHPLVIWALSDSRLLFADLANNKFFEQKISGAPGSKKGKVGETPTFATSKVDYLHSAPHLCKPFVLPLRKISPHGNRRHYS